MYVDRIMWIGILHDELRGGVSLLLSPAFLRNRFSYFEDLLQMQHR